MERRDFLLKSSLITAGVGIGLIGCKRNVAPMAYIPDGERIRVGIIGMGDRGSAIIDVLNKLPDIKLVACCDILDFRLKNGIDRINEEVVAYKDYRKLLEHKGLEAVIISHCLFAHYV